MIKINKHIEIVRSSTMGLSSMGSKSATGIFTLLSKHYTKVSMTVVNNLADLESVVIKRPDLVFLGLKYISTNPSAATHGSSKIWAADYLDKHGIPYTGSEYQAHELEYNKPVAKQCILNAGLNTSPYCVFERNSAKVTRLTSLNYPVFVKPTNCGGGVGIDSDSVAYSFEELQSKVQSISHNIKSNSLVEEFLPGREFSVAILKDKETNSFLILPIEKVPPLDNRGKRILSKQIKSANSVRDLVVTDNVLKDKLTQLAIKAFHALGARDYGRIDIRLNHKGIPQFLEANLIPSLIEGYGSFPKACMLNLKMDYETMIMRIVELGLDRNTNTSNDIIKPANTLHSRILSIV